MPIVFDGSAGTVTGIATGGLPDGCVDTDTLASGLGSQGISEFDSWRLNAYTSVSGGDGSVLSNWERDDSNFEKIGTGLTHSGGIFTFPSTGKYLITTFLSFTHTRESDYGGLFLSLSTNGGSSYAIKLRQYAGIHGAGGYGCTSGQKLIDVTDASTFKFKFQYTLQYDTATYRGDTDVSETGFTCIKIGAT